VTPPDPAPCPARRALLLGAAAAALGGCTPVLIPMGPPTRDPAIEGDALVMADGARLPLRAWLPEGPSRCVVLALHGFGEYARSFLEDVAPRFTEAGMALYGYDQRGFGEAPHRGYWAGAATLAADAAEAARLIRARHPGTRLVLLGESMGGAVLMVAATAAEPPPVDGYILLAPAVWGRDFMPRFLVWLLDTAAVTIPIVGFRNSAPGIVPTDNAEALRRWASDPFILRETRVDAAKGLVDLMDAAVAAAPRLGTVAPPAAAAPPVPAPGRGRRAPPAPPPPAPPPVLLLYGGRDALVPGAPTRRVLARLPPEGRHRVAYYAQGYHMLLRDRNGPVVVGDILAWAENPATPLPSGADRAAIAWLGAAPAG
jgi:alpha-beta hydrolase superfamily lysophospholipase